MIPRKTIPPLNASVAEHPPSISLIDRAAMSGLSSMQVDGELRNLGIVKNFRDNQEINRHLPTNISISWAHLDPKETLDTHRHPIASLIIAVQGAGQSKGDTSKAFIAGDSLLIPEWNEHGFTGSSPDGLWALSIQFSEVAIFENEADPLTVFADAGVELPSLDQRQIKIIERKSTLHPASFKSDPNLSKVLPQNIDFSWHRPSSNDNLQVPVDGYKRLIIVASGAAQLQLSYSSDDSNNSLSVVAGDAFWQNQDMSFAKRDDSGLWLLLIDVKSSQLSLDGGVQ